MFRHLRHAYWALQMRVQPQSTSVMLMRQQRQVVDGLMVVTAMSNLTLRSRKLCIPWYADINAAVARH